MSEPTKGPYEACGSLIVCRREQRLKSVPVELDRITDKVLMI